MTSEAVGTLAGMLTSMCWIPQAFKILRTRETGSISLVAQLTLCAGCSLWTVYGVLTCGWSIVAFNTVTAILAGAIAAMKVRYG